MAVSAKSRKVTDCVAGRCRSLPRLLFAVLALFAAAQVKAQTFILLRDFSGGNDGRYPIAGLTIDRGGNLYGTTEMGGGGSCEYGCGTVFKLSQRGSGWILTQLFAFPGGQDGAYPEARVTIGPNGSFYGNTCGQDAAYCTGLPFSQTGMLGTVFNLHPPPHAPDNILGGWTQTVIYPDAGTPSGQLVFDPEGNIYGTNGSCVFELMPSDGGWTPSLLHCFAGGSDGYSPRSGVVLDRAGNLYGTTFYGGTGDCDEGCGTVFQVTRSGAGWTETVLHSFQGRNDGAYPIGGLTFDSVGNVYGTASYGGRAGGGTVFELTPSANGWSYRLIYSLQGVPCEEPPGPYDNLSIDSAGSLYGTTLCDGGSGNVFKLTPNPQGGWSYTDIYQFHNQFGAPIGGVALDAHGNIYGTSAYGGDYGAVWEIVP